MQYKSENDKRSELIMLVSKKKTVTISLVAVLSYVVMAIIFKDNAQFYNTIINIIYIVGSFTMLLLTKSIYTEHNEGIFKFISVLYIIIALENTRSLLPMDNGILKGVFGYSIFFGKNLINIVICLMYYRALQNKDMKKSVFKVAIIIGMLILSINLIKSDLINQDLLLCVINISTIVITLKTMKKLKKYDIHSEKKINFIEISIMNRLVISILAIMYIIYKNNSYSSLILLLYGLIYFIEFLVVTSSIANKILKHPYRILFNELYAENFTLNELNKKVINKNKELEISQIIIKNKEATFKTFFKSIPLPLIMINKENSRIAFSNNEFKKLVDKDIRQIINKKIKNLIEVEVEGDFKDVDKNKSFEKVYRGIIHNKLGDKYVNIEIVDINKSSNCSILIFTDVTSKVKSDNIKKSMQNKVFEETLKRDFLSNISHDLKTPINVIYSAIQLMKFYIKDNNLEELQNYNNISIKNCVSLIRFTDDIIDNNKVNSNNIFINLVEKNIVEEIEEIVTSLVKYSKTKNVELIFDTSNEEIYIKIDVHLIERIMLNLISNALKFCREKGIIKVIIEEKKETVGIFVEDNGIGMEKEFLESAFSRYSMGGNNKEIEEKGTGIGLYAVKKMVEEQNGTIGIKSEIGKGTCFKIEFKKGNLS